MHNCTPSQCLSSGKCTRRSLHAIAILQVYQVKALKELHQGRSDPRLMKELCSATEVMTQASDPDVYLGAPRMA